MVVNFVIHQARQPDEISPFLLGNVSRPVLKGIELFLYQVCCSRRAITVVTMRSISLNSNDHLQAGVATPPASPSIERGAGRHDVPRAARHIPGHSFSVRGVAVGLLVGLIICFSNMYFGLQTGWVRYVDNPEQGSLADEHCPIQADRLRNQLYDNAFQSSRFRYFQGNITLPTISLQSCRKCTRSDSRWLHGYHAFRVRLCWSCTTCARLPVLLESC